MLYPLCPSCGSLLSNIQLPYERDMLALCEKYNIDHEAMSRGIVDNDKFNKEKQNIVNKYTDKHRYCCKMRLTNYVKVVELVN